MELIDTHCHIDRSHFEDDFEGVIQRSISAGVTGLVIPGFVQAGWQRLLKLCRHHEKLHAAPGLHPCYLSEHRPSHLEELETLCQQNKLIAIGEIGLDFYHGTHNEKEQKKLFNSQLEIAERHGLPVLLHVRKAHDQVLSILRKKRPALGGIVHAFNGSYQQANQYINLGFKLGYGGTLSYNRATKIKTVASLLPLSAIVLETDAPDIPLFHRRDKINSPEFLPEILDALVSIRDESRNEIAATTTLNARAILSNSKYRV